MYVCMHACMYVYTLDELTRIGTLGLYRVHMCAAVLQSYYLTVRAVYIYIYIMHMYVYIHIDIYYMHMPRVNPCPHTNAPYIHTRANNHQRVLSYVLSLGVVACNHSFHSLRFGPNWSNSGLLFFRIWSKGLRT